MGLIFSLKPESSGDVLSPVWQSSRKLEITPRAAKAVREMQWTASSLYL